MKAMTERFWRFDLTGRIMTSLQKIPYLNHPNLWLLHDMAQGTLQMWLVETLRWGDYPEFSRWASNVGKVFKSDKRQQKRRVRAMIRQTKCCWFEDRGRGPQEEKRKEIDSHLGPLGRYTAWSGCYPPSISLHFMSCYPWLTVFWLNLFIYHPCRRTLPLLLPSVWHALSLHFPYPNWSYTSFLFQFKYHFPR